jgi:DNA-binding MarR family transcriptional regulator
LDVLDYLHLNKNATAKEISTDLNIPKQHTSKILIKFEDDKLVKCEENESDKRSKRYSLTDDGFKLMQLHIMESNNHFDEIIAKLSIEEQEEFTDAMVILLNILKKL